MVRAPAVCPAAMRIRSHAHGRHGPRVEAMARIGGTSGPHPQRQPCIGHAGAAADHCGPSHDYSVDCRLRQPGRHDEIPTEMNISALVPRHKLQNCIIVVVDRETSSSALCDGLPLWKEGWISRIIPMMLATTLHDDDQDRRPGGSEAASFVDARRPPGRRASSPRRRSAPSSEARGPRPCRAGLGRSRSGRRASREAGGQVRPSARGAARRVKRVISEGRPRRRAKPGQIPVPLPT